MTRFAVRISVRGQIGIQNAYDYYEELQEGLGDRFMSEMSEYLTVLERLPYFRKRYQDVRMLPLSRFPFSIHYKIMEAENSVIVLAVISSHRDPNIWPGTKK